MNPSRAEVAPVPFATLMGAELVAPSQSPMYFLVDKTLLVDCMGEFVRRIYFDETWYLTAYPDVAEAVRNKSVASAQEHFARFGYFENRLPYSIAVDEAWYRSTYRDVREAIAARRFASCQAHFEQVGYAEGRLPHPGFSLRTARPESGS
ncbi:MAG TPA: hypothetical protein VGS12_05545 [Caulobacteraceae bacterium]|nr:hypothetical protein [Caulobacteraceae bacterium]